MKVAVTFLFVALSCLQGSGDALLGGKPVKPGKSGKHAPSHVPKIPKDCIKQLVQNDLPEVLIALQKMLCNYMAGKKTHNMELYELFLRELHETLITCGCSLDDILQTEQFLECVGDQVGKVAEDLGPKVLSVVEELGLSDKLLNVLCDALGDTLLNLAHTLAGLNVDTKLVNGVVGKILPIL